jgi:hypothetical protein
MRTVVVAAVVGVGIVVGMLGGRPVAFAADDDPPCMKDIARWCSQMPDMDPYLDSCLHGHYDDVSPECRKSLNKDPRREEKVRHACQADVDKLCADVPLAGALNLECLMKQKDALSTKCRDALLPKPADTSASAPQPADGVEIITPKGSDLAPIEVKPSQSE